MALKRTTYKVSASDTADLRVQENYWTTFKDLAGADNIYVVGGNSNATILNSGGTTATDIDQVFVEGLEAEYQIKSVGRVVYLKSESHQIRIQFQKVTGSTLTDKIVFQDGTADLVAKFDSKGKATITLGASGSTAQKLTTKLVDVTATLDSTTDSVDKFAGVVTTTTGGSTVTVHSDDLTDNVFNAGLDYTPGGNDRVNTLQDEDTLTGTGTNPTLNVTLGNYNDNGTSVVTPILKNIQTVNVNATGDTNTLDLRNADSITTLNVNRITAAAGNSFTFDNISQATANNLSVLDTSKVFVNVNFNFADTVLQGTTSGADAESGNVTVKNVNLASLHVGNSAGTEGFETLALKATGVNTIKNFDAVDLENITITNAGGAVTDKLNLLDTDSNDGLPGDQRINFTAGNGIAIGDGLGIRSIDASAFTGTLNIDITNATGGHTDPVNSGVKFYTDIKGGSGDDTFWSGGSIAGESATKRDNIDGGAGSNVLRTYNSITALDYFDTATDDIAHITNIQTLEIREDFVAVDMDAFDSTLTTVIMRDENVVDPGGLMVVYNITPTLATSGNLILRHSQDGEDVATPFLFLKNGAGASDTVKVTVQNDFNTEFQFDYSLLIDGNPFVTGAAAANEKVENVTIADNDTESNTVQLLATDSSGKSEHTGTILLTGGTAGKFYEIDSTLIANTVNGTAQLSDLRLTVGTANQAIGLGTGNDILTFANLDDFSASDTITDAGGTDTLRAAFSKDVTGTPNLAGIEKLHIVATQNMSMNLVNATGITELAILSDQAVNGDTDESPITREPFGITSGIQVTDVITLSNTNIGTLNFFADNDNNDDSFTETGNHIFNGVNLASNAQSTLTVAINSSLDKGDGADSYALGQLTLGATNMTIAVGDERAIAAGATASTTATSINNMLVQQLTTLTVTANGSVDLGTVTGNGTKNNITSINTTGVLGDFTAAVVGLGNNAVVNLGNGQNTFHALGSSGTNVTINSGLANDSIWGTDQIDNINAGAGHDFVEGYKGNNVMDAGAGDDSMQAWGGSDTYSFGSGTMEYATDNNGTGDTTGTTATNLFTLQGSTVLTQIDYNGDGANEVYQMLAGGDGTTLTVRWDGTSPNMVYASSSLNGSTAVTSASLAVATYNGNASDNFVIANDGNVTTFNGGDGADAFIVEANAGGAATARTFNGGTGNDAFVGSSAGDDITGGTGADRLVLSYSNSGDGAADILHFSVGDSTATGYDQVQGFETGGTDVLDLATTTIAAATGDGNIFTTGDYIDGVDAGTGTTGVGAHEVDSSGQVAFLDADGNFDWYAGTGPNQISLTNALTYLATALDNTGSTVTFYYDRHGDSSVYDTFVFQDGVQDTVVQLVGTIASGVTTGAVGSLVTIS
jgi:hypothetical protein